METSEQRRFEKFRNGVQRCCPELARRVFVVGQRFYMGCGFHYGMAAELGTVIHRAFSDRIDFWHGKDALAERITFKVLVEGLHRNIKQAEWSADHNAEEDPRWRKKKEARRATSQKR